MIQKVNYSFQIQWERRKPFLLVRIEPASFTQTTNNLSVFKTKVDATAGGVLKKTTCGEGSIKIKKEDGTYQEERTFPRSEDPKKSKG